MRSIIAVLMALVFTCGIVAAQTDTSTSGSTGSGDTSMSQQGGSTGGAAGEEKTITGEIKNVNKDQKEITVTGPQGNQMQYTLNDSTVIVSETGQAMMIGDLKDGSKVTITYTGTPGVDAKVSKVQVKEGK